MELAIEVNMIFSQFKKCYSQVNHYWKVFFKSPYHKIGMKQYCLASLVSWQTIEIYRGGKVQQQKYKRTKTVNYSVSKFGANVMFYMYLSFFNQINSCLPPTAE